MIAFVAIVLFAVVHLTSSDGGHLISHGMWGHRPTTSAPEQGAHS
jgi:hypothetical protein